MIRAAEDALQFVKSALGGQGLDSIESILEDGVIRQDFDVARAASAGFDLGLGPGLFSGAMTQSHVAAGDITETLDPYNPGTVVAPLTLSFLPPLEWWYLGSQAVVTAITQTIDEVQFAMEPATIEGFNDGTVTGGQSVLARWDAILPNAGGVTVMINEDTGQAFQAPPFPVRWSRNNLIRVGSQTTGVGATTIRVQSWWYLGRRGLTPSAF